MTTPPPARPPYPPQGPAAGHDPFAAPHGVTPLYGDGFDGDAMPLLYERLRAEHGPVAPVLLAPGLGAWLVLGHRELLRLTRDEVDFSHDPRRWRLLREGRVPADSPILPMVGWRPALLFVDGREHRRMRAPVAAALAAVDGHELRRDVQSDAEDLIAAFSGRGEADLVRDYARKLPMRVITRLLGLDADTGRELVTAIAGLARGDADSARASARADEIMLALVREKRRAPGGDVTSALLAHPAALDDTETVATLVTMFVASNQTTLNWIATTLRIILCDPAFRSSLTGGRLSVDDALDLVLWRFPPTQNFPARYATRDLRLGRQDVREGDMLVLGLAAANADPAVLPADGGPVVGNRSHLAFSAGPHSCPAQDPARLITRAAVDTLRHRLPDLELAVPESELSWIKSPWSKGLAALPVRFSAPRPPGAETAPPASVPSAPFSPQPPVPRPDAPQAGAAL
ncbi:cytochrome P450 [Streptomyces sp. NPDC050560]|uniref:cytochrome P450 n=1 Tax=Streptomyces sp. NPDC050560 TaxID=3365630 RepID=UPI00378F13F3